MECTNGDQNSPGRFAALLQSVIQGYWFIMNNSSLMNIINLTSPKSSKNMTKRDTNSRLSPQVVELNDCYDENIFGQHDTLF